MSTQRYAIVRKGIVENVTLWDGDANTWQPPEGSTAYAFPTGPISKGWPWNDGAPIDPNPPEAQPEPDYKELRRREYPPVGDQLDALWKGGPDADAMKAVIVAIKIKYPKPEGGGK